MERRTGRDSSAPARTSPDGERGGRLRERLAAGDERALAELVEVATPWLLNIARAMLHDEDEAEEVVMEAFRTVWQNVTPPSGEHAGLMPYLIRITRHRAIDRLRGRRRRERKLGALALEAARVVPPSEPDEAGGEGWHVHTQVHAALRDLPADQQAVIELAYFQGLTHSEVAAELGIPLGTVKTRLRLGFGRLRTTLEGLRDWVV